MSRTEARPIRGWINNLSQDTTYTETPYWWEEVDVKIGDVLLFEDGQFLIYNGEIIPMTRISSLDAIERLEAQREYNYGRKTS